MSLDILEGDILVVSGIEYKIRRAADFHWRLGARGSSFDRLASFSCSTKRHVVAGDVTDPNLKKRSVVPTENLTGLKCMPLDPIRAKLAESEGLGRIHTLLETFITDDTSYKHLWVEREL